MLIAYLLAKEVNKLEGAFWLTAIGFGLICVMAQVILLLATRYKRCASDEILVVYGRVDGGEASRCIHGGGIMVWPMIQDYKILSLTPMTIDIPLTDALSKDNTQLNVFSTFTAGLSTEPSIMNNAAERLLHLDRSQIKRLASEIISGQLRSTISSLTIKQINSDRDQLLDLMSNNVGRELNEVGIKIININITEIIDDSESTDRVTEEKLTHYLGLTKRARAKATPIHSEGTSEAKQLEVMMRMADDYASDAQHFMDNGDYVRAFGAINYAHAWIDAGVKLRLLDGHGDDVLFTLP